MSMNINALQREVDKIASEVNARYAQQSQQPDVLKELFPGFRLFTTEEQAQLEQLLTTISTRVVFKYGGLHDFLGTATHEELETLYRFSNLQDALKDNDQAAITRHRSALANA